MSIQKRQVEIKPTHVEEARGARGEFKSAICMLSAQKFSFLPTSVVIISDMSDEIANNLYLVGIFIRDLRSRPPAPRRSTMASTPPTSFSTSWPVSAIPAHRSPSSRRLR
jgi:hypothetical protein